jgi:8-oxo-dGTP diphosphatase
MREIVPTSLVPSPDVPIKAPALRAIGVKKILKLDESELLLVVAAALIDPHGRVLVQQRPPGKSMAGLWEFPGGKIEIGETPEAALVRELREELGIIANALAPLAFASEALGEQHLVMLLFECRAWTGAPEAIHASAVQWVAPDALHNLPMPPADLPLIASITRAAQRVGE